MKVKFRDAEYPLLTVDRMTFGEIGHAEKLLKLRFDDWSTMDTVRVGFWVSIRRVDHTILPWDAMTEVTPADFTEVPEPGDEAGDDEIPPDPSAAD